MCLTRYQANGEMYLFEVLSDLANSIPEELSQGEFTRTYQLEVTCEGSESKLDIILSFSCKEKRRLSLGDDSIQQSGEPNMLVGRIFIQCDDHQEFACDKAVNAPTPRQIFEKILFGDPTNPPPCACEDYPEFDEEEYEKLLPSSLSRHIESCMTQILQGSERAAKKPRHDLDEESRVFHAVATVFDPASAPASAPVPASAASSAVVCIDLTGDD